MRNESFQFGGPANKLVALYAAENLAHLLIAVVVHLAAGAREVVDVKLDAVFALRLWRCKERGRRRRLRFQQCRCVCANVEMPMLTLTMPSGCDLP